MFQLLQDPWLGLPWSLADTAVVAAFTLGALLSARLLFRWTDGAGTVVGRAGPAL